MIAKNRKNKYRSNVENKESNFEWIVRNGILNFKREIIDRERLLEIDFNGE